MVTVVYGDILFAVNFSMDFIALFFASRILHLGAGALRLSAAAVIGGVYGVAAVLLDMNRALELPASVAVCGIMCLVAFGYGGAKRYFLSVLLFFVSGAALSGIMTAMISLAPGFNGAGAADSDGAVAPRAFAVAALAAVLLTYVTGRAFSEHGRKKTVEIRIRNGDAAADFIALVDSGNLLSEPISGRPAILIGMDSVRGLIPEELGEIIPTAGMPELERLSVGSLRRTRLLTAHGIGGDRLLTAYLPDRVEVLKNGRTRRVDAVIAIDPDNCVYGGEAEAVIPSCLVF